MSAELLRRAAKSLRDRAAGTSTSPDAPWVVDDFGFIVTKDAASGEVVADCLRNERPDNGPDEANAAYIALMHPPVALALADLLDAHAESVEEEGPHFTMTSDLDAAFDVARAILREDTP